METVLLIGSGIMFTVALTIMAVCAVVGVMCKAIKEVV